MSGPYGAGIQRGQMAADKFTQISNALFRDSRMSYKAKGIFGLISTHTDGWRVTIEDLVRASTDGKAAVTSGVKELEQFGYLVRDRERNPDGTLGGAVYSITDMPAHLFELFGEDAPDLPQIKQTRRSEPKSENPALDNPAQGNPPTKNTKLKNTNNSKNTSAPAARAAGDARRAGAGSSASERAGGSAASSGAGAPNTGARSGKARKTGGARMSAEQAAAVATVEAAWPEALAGLLPKYRPVVIRDTILAALDGGRTAEQLAERVRRRWWNHGYAMDAMPGGKGIGSAVGVAVGLVRASTDCPDPMCEDGARIHVGPRDVCPKCEERRAARRADRRQGVVPGPRGAAGPALVWWECEGTTPKGRRCEATGKGTRPEDGLCWVCHDRVEAEVIERATAGLRAERDAEYAAQAERARAAAQWALLLDDAYAEDAEREAAKGAAVRARRAAEVEETRRLREQWAREHPELAAYAQQPEDQPATAPF